MWEDIKDDIENGYDSCCCKLVLFQQLNLINNEQKHNEYKRLKQCLEPNKVIQKGSIQKPLSKDVEDESNISNTFEHGSIEDVAQQIHVIFSSIYGNTFGEQIANIFERIVNEELFDDIQSVQEEVEDINDSLILQDIIREMEPHLNSFNEKQIRKIETKLQQTLLNPYADALHESKEENKQKQNKEEKQTENEENNKKENDQKQMKKIEEIKRKILQEFSEKYNETIALNIWNEFNSLRITEAVKYLLVVVAKVTFA